MKPKNIVLPGTQIVLPEALEQRAINIAHESHQGLSKIKALLRTKTWFPGTDDLAKRTSAKRPGTTTNDGHAIWCMADGPP